VQTVTLRNLRDDDGTRHLEARVTKDGDVVFSGQDLGRGVEQIFGEGLREYEWTWTIARAHVPALARALDATTATLLTCIADRFSDPHCAEIEPFLRAHRIAFARWSRVGD
jgi:hypothetical protein